MRLLKITAAILLIMVLAGSVCAQSSAMYDLTWNSIDAGGDTSTGGIFKLAGVAGQPDAGQMTGGTFALSGGFLQDSTYFPVPVTLTALQLE